MCQEPCEKCGSEEWDSIGDPSIGEQHAVCSECGHTLYYFCKADEEEY